MNNNLIFDLGFHRGEDTSYYLYKGFQVVAIDADPKLVESGRHKFINELSEKRLVLLNRVIDAWDKRDTFFYISQNSQWSSVHKEIAERKGNPSFPVRLQAVSLPTLMKEYGVPYYCKIDIEGNDIIALRSLSGIQERPLYISVETECIGDKTQWKDRIFDTLEELHALGYNKFKLVDQRTLTVLDFSSFYKGTGISFDPLKTNKEYAKSILGLHGGEEMLFSDVFPDSSGPFGEYLSGEWFDYYRARKLIEFHRHAQRLYSPDIWSFWCDWHATM